MLDLPTVEMLQFLFSKRQFCNADLSCVNYSSTYIVQYRVVIRPLLRHDFGCKTCHPSVFPFSCRTVLASSSGATLTELVLTGNYFKEIYGIIQFGY
jgi:hypothetical protein